MVGAVNTRLAGKRRKEIPHESFRQLSPDVIRSMFVEGKVLLMDIKGFWNKQEMLGAGFDLWRL